MPSVILTRLRVSNSRFLGPIELELNPQYNALIGGRGTGKSTCLEYLRWGLCDQPPRADAEDDGSNLATRRRRLIEQTLIPLDGHVEAHFERNGVPHVVRRYAKSGDVHLKVGQADLAPSTEADVRALLPIEAYSQRQLSGVGVQTDELMRFITAPIRQQLDELATNERRLEADIRENHARLQRYRALQLTIARDRLAVDSLGQQVEAMRAALGGLSEEDRAVLAAKTLHDDGQALVEGWDATLGEAHDELRSAVALLDRLSSAIQAPPPGVPAYAVIERLGREVEALLRAARAATDAAVNQLSAGSGSTSETGRLRAAWEAEYRQFMSRYDAATARSTAHESRLQELSEAEDRLRQMRKSLDGQVQQLDALGDPSTRHMQLREEWHALQRRRAAHLAEQCARLTSLSKGAIRASVEAHAGTAPQESQFKAALQGANVRASKTESFVEAVAGAADPLAAWQESLDALEDLVLAAASGAPTAHPSVPGPLAAFSESDLQRIALKLTPEALLDLSVLPLDNRPMFEYRSKEAEYIAFADASAGQQATALLRVLLNQGGPPLIIDQPEDDLDSQVILDLVENIWDAKGRRQLIFSSHNANLVVNGDAELVSCFAYRNVGDHSAGHIALEGAIDIPDVCDRITLVMEGGERAFRLRKEKYGF